MRKTCSEPGAEGREQSYLVFSATSPSKTFTDPQKVNSLGLFRVDGCLVRPALVVKVPGD